jgi:hypothetical protein
MENIVKNSTVPVTHKCHSRLPPNDRFSGRPFAATLRVPRGTYRIAFRH